MGMLAKLLKNFDAVTCNLSSYSHVEVISLVSLALPAISARFSGSVLSIACHCKSVILSGLTVSAFMAHACSFWN